MTPARLALRTVVHGSLWTAALIAGLMVLAWATRSDASSARSDTLRVALFINGTLGDKSFFDAAARGVRQAAADDAGVTARVVEGGIDPTRWEGILTDLVDGGDYDVVVVGTFTMVPYVEALARDYPDMRFIMYDAAVDTQRCGCDNVHALLFRQNEGAYLAGHLAAHLLGHGLPPARALGIVGGMALPVIDDFIVGFSAGARAARPDIALYTQYANSFSDPAVGKEIAKVQFARGAGVVFHAAGATGAGVNEAALESGAYAIGVDLDQYALYATTRPALARHIVTSVLKRVDTVVARAIAQMRRGELRFGVSESLGLAQGAVDLAMDSEVLARAPEDVRSALATVRAQVIDGTVIVPSAFAHAPAHWTTPAAGVQAASDRCATGLRHERC